MTKLWQLLPCTTLEICITLIITKSCFANDIIIDNAGIIALMEVADMAAEKELNICHTQKS